MSIENKKSTTLKTIKTTPVKITTTVNITASTIENILAGAFEGYNSLWYSTVYTPSKEGVPSSVPLSEHFSYGGKTIILEDFESNNKYTLTLNKLIKGIKLYFENTIGSLQYLEGDNVLNTCMIDGIECDNILQYAIFGDIIYG